MMRPSTKEGKSSKEKISARFAPMYVPNLSWDFYDAFCSSAPTKVAHERQTISTTEKNLEKYLKIARNQEIKKNRQVNLEGTIQLPRYLQIMLKLQSDNGKFENLDILLQLLEIPKNSFSTFSSQIEWEQATSLAVATMRLNPELFEPLRVSYERAFAWIDSNQIVYEARAILLSRAGDGYEPKVTSQMDSSSSLSSTQAPAPPTIDKPTFMSGQLATIPEQEDGNSVTSNFINHNTSSSGGYLSPPRSANDGFSNLLPTMLQPGVDPEKLAAQRQRVEECELQVLAFHERIEILVRDISDCMVRCVKAYNACELFVDRYRTFDELTARLGEGFNGSPAYEDWRRLGVPSYRVAVLDFLNAVQTMAEERLTLLEVLQPLGRDWTQTVQHRFTRLRWSLVFNGHHLVHKVLHYLDFLRKCRELSDWYGQGFRFVANPLMLPFPLHAPTLEKLGVTSGIQDQLNSMPHARQGIADPTRKADWQHQQTLNEFRRHFIKLAEDRSFNWPEMPIVREETINQRLYQAVLVLGLCAEPSLRRSHAWETEFMGKIATERGAATHLVGAGNLKDDKKLYIPPLEVRKPRAALFQQQSLKRKNSRHSSNGRSEDEDDELFVFDTSTLPLDLQNIDTSDNNLNNRDDNNNAVPSENNVQTSSPAVEKATTTATTVPAHVPSKRGSHIVQRAAQFQHLLSSAAQRQKADLADAARQQQLQQERLRAEQRSSGVHGDGNNSVVGDEHSAGALEFLDNNASQELSESSPNKTKGGRQQSSPKQVRQLRGASMLLRNQGVPMLHANYLSAVAPVTPSTNTRARSNSKLQTTSFVLPNQTQSSPGKSPDGLSSRRASRLVAPPSTAAAPLHKHSSSGNMNNTGNLHNANSNTGLLKKIKEDDNSNYESLASSEEPQNAPNPALSSPQWKQRMQQQPQLLQGSGRGGRGAVVLSPMRKASVTANAMSKRRMNSSKGGGALLKEASVSSWSAGGSDNQALEEEKEGSSSRELSPVVRAQSSRSGMRRTSSAHALRSMGVSSRAALLKESAQSRKVSRILLAPVVVAGAEPNSASDPVTTSAAAGTPVRRMTQRRALTPNSGLPARKASALLSSSLTAAKDLMKPSVSSNHTGAS